MADVLTVSELTQGIKKHLETKFPYMCVQGEISNLKQPSSGHLYFTLKDSQSQIPAVLFRGQAQQLTKLPKNGDQVILKGELTVYGAGGYYQVLVRDIEFSGVGQLLLKLHELKIKLTEKGWFNSERKKTIPKMPKTIGVVTSPTGAVIQDILNVLSRRAGGFRLILNPVKVQGEGAAAEIAQAIDQFNQYGLADVLIVGRGGGSLEDLWAFNEEIVASAIYRSTIPIISAIGHETDYTIADFVSDIRAPTPSAAAEIVIAAKVEQMQLLEQIQYRSAQHINNVLRENRQKIDLLIDNLDRTMGNKLERIRLRCHSAQKQTLALNPITQIRNGRQKILYWERALRTSIGFIQRKREKLQQLTAHLKAIDPKNLLTKGYCIPFLEKNDSIILSTKNINVGEQIRLLMSDGAIKAVVNERKP